ncbi:unnamed protein product [Didymodactylos carnosus]|uniref:FHA domain-containing protein n=1 Tax=Didymodactylos carnosus TaxID=1234261 RepID=A0A813Q0R5_9BILA|nr:unnamed protein product [Didymodactylos carnosus]CAF0981917.1 unnamed protein product [Didymodactylos carnosus]CAF3540714.1 unnamed protein product [Didymodactylos carnosus]CAF3752480.1 unnamed protein product [Didymodactylos carnosus]
MTRSPKTRTNNSDTRRKKRKRSSSSESDNSDHDQRYRRRQQQDHRSNIRIKEEPITDDDSRRKERPPFPRQQQQQHSNNRQKEKSSYEWGPRQQVKNEDEQSKIVEREKPNFGLSGALLKDTNLYRGVVIKYNEPIEARKPKRRWRLYVFKGEEELPLYQIHRQSAYLFGRERMIADIPIDHPSCSKQHAVLQYRLMDYKRDDGSSGRRVVPYIIDLGSANGTFINNKKIESQRYYELKENDVIKFAFSTREYVLLHEDSATSILREGEEDEGIENPEKDTKEEVDTKK